MPIKGGVDKTGLGNLAGQDLNLSTFLLNKKFVQAVFFWYVNFNCYAGTILNYPCMNTQNQIGFITDKIQQLQTAILQIHSNSLLKLPTSLVETIHVDELGCVWISVNKPTQYLHEFDRSFHVALNYYRKGMPFYLNSYGIARVVLDPEEINNIPADLRQQLSDNKLLICVRILEANYYEKEPKTVQNIFQKCKQTFSDLFVGSNEYYHYKEEDKTFYA